MGPLASAPAGARLDRLFHGSDCHVDLACTSIVLVAQPKGDGRRRHLHEARRAQLRCRCSPHPCRLDGSAEDGRSRRYTHFPHTGVRLRHSGRPVLRIHRSREEKLFLLTYSVDQLRHRFDDSPAWSSSRPNAFGTKLWRGAAFPHAAPLECCD